MRRPANGVGGDVLDAPFVRSRFARRGLRRHQGTRFREAEATCSHRASRGRGQPPYGLCVDFLLKRVATFGSLVQRELPRKRVRDCQRFTIPPPLPSRLRRAELSTSLYTREAFCKCEQRGNTALRVCAFTRQTVRVFVNNAATLAFPKEGKGDRDSGG